MTNLQTLNGCTCLVQYVNLSCPFPYLTCKDCVFNPLSWCYYFDHRLIHNALNQSRVISTIKVPNLFK